MKNEKTNRRIPFSSFKSGRLGMRLLSAKRPGAQAPLRLGIIDPELSTAARMGEESSEHNYVSQVVDNRSEYSMA